MTIPSLDALRDAIRASTGPDLDQTLGAAFAEHVLGWTDPRRFGSAVTYVAPDGSYCELPDFFDPIAGPGALFAAARERWPDVAMRVEVWMSAAGPQALAMFEDRREERHPLLTHALALAMVEAAIQERDNR